MDLIDFFIKYNTHILVLLFILLLIVITISTVNKAKRKKATLQRNAVIPTTQQQPMQRYIAHSSYEKPKPQSKGTLKKVGIAILIIGIVLFLYETGFSFTSSPVNTNRPSIFDVFSEKEEFPEHGTIKIFTQKERIAGLKITTAAEGVFYYIKLKSLDYSGEDIKIYIHGDTTIETMIPLGRYEWYYAIGDTWHGEYDLFGARAEYLKSSHIIETYIDDNIIMGKHITILSSYVHSNSNQPANRNDFR